MQYFLYIEFTNKKTREFLHSLMNVLSEKNNSDIPHVTIRGPYNEIPSDHEFEEVSKSIENDFLCLRDPNIIHLDNSYIIYLTVYSKNLDRIWWKPDYLGKKYKKINHVTLVEVSSFDKAQIILNFLRQENINIVTHGLALSLHTIRQRKINLTAYDDNLNLDLERIDITPQLLERAENLMNTLSQYEDKYEAEPQFLFA